MLRRLTFKQISNFVLLRVVILSPLNIFVEYELLQLLELLFLLFIVANFTEELMSFLAVIQLLMLPDLSNDLIQLLLLFSMLGDLLFLLSLQLLFLLSKSVI